MIPQREAFYSVPPTQLQDKIFLFQLSHGVSSTHVQSSL